MMLTDKSFAADRRAALVDRAVKCGLAARAENVGLWGGMFTKSVDSIDGGGVHIEGFASAEAVDFDREVLVPDGLDFGPFERFKTVYMDHVYGVMTSVGTLRYVNKTGHWSGKAWRIKVRMLPESVCPEAPRIVELAKHGAMGFSVGFMAKDHGKPTEDEARRYPKARSIVRKAEVFEVSFTSMPCNMACTADVVSVDDSKAATVETLVRKHRWPWRVGGGMMPRETIVLV